MERLMALSLGVPPSGPAAAKPGADGAAASSFEAAAAESSLRFQAGWLLLQLFGALLFQGIRWLNLLPIHGVWLVPPLCIAAGVRALCLCLSKRLLRRFVHHLAMFCLLLDVGLLTSCHPEVSSGLWWGAPCSEMAPPSAPSMEIVMEELEYFSDTAIDEREEKLRQWFQPGSNQRFPSEADFYMEIDRLRSERQLYQRMKAERRRLHRASQAYQQGVERWVQQQLASTQQYLFDYMLVVCGMLMQLWYMVTFVLPFGQGACMLPLCFLLYCLAVAFAQRGGLPDLGGFHALKNALEFSILAFGSIVNLAAKLRSEQTQRQVCRFMDEQQKEVIQQKVLRCKAEYEQEQLIEDLNKEYQAGPDRREPSLSECRVAPCPSPPPAPAAARPAGGRAAKAPASLRSAPPAPRGFLEAGLECGTRSRGDCLPPGATVWVEGRPLPTAVGKVSAGQRVLCFDTVGRCPKYVEVTELRVLAGEVQWVTVVLADGTEFSVTANHPMQPQPSASDREGLLPYIGSSVQAKDLKPDCDSLMVLKLTPVAVKAVKGCEAGGPGTAVQRVSMLLRQPDRHEVFVAPANTEPHRATVAVGSANAGVEEPGAQIPLGPVVKRTFIDVAPTVGLRARRASSLPPRFLGGGGSEAAASGSAAPANTSSAAGSGGGRAGRRSRMRRSLSESELSSSALSSENVDAEVLVSMDAQASEPAALSQLLSVHRQGLPSLGSAGHAEGSCQVCIFHSRSQREGKEPCWKGFLCERCHESHDPESWKKKKHKSGGLRRFLKKCANAEKIESL